MAEIPQLLVHEHDDNVGVVVVEDLKAGTDMLCCITADNSTFRLTSKADVPIGHKVALKDLKAGDRIHLTQSALVLEEVIGQFLFSKAEEASKGEGL